MNGITNLSDTVDLMLSSSYVDQFKAEYNQTKIRYDKLCQRIHEQDVKEADYNNVLCTLQGAIMKNYLSVLEDRAEIEGIVLDKQAEDIA